MGGKLYCSECGGVGGWLIVVVCWLGGGKFCGDWVLCNCGINCLECVECYWVFCCCG